jgi:hypothetical protein
MTTATLDLLRGTAWTPGLAAGDWSTWAQASHPERSRIPTGAADAPTLDFLPALQRRRLSRPARLALQVAHDCLAGEHADHIVWSSRHGDSNKTLDILRDLARQEAVSPTAFSTSVHNAPAGLYSILFNDDSPSSSLSAGTESLSQACWEAAALLGSGQAERVLVVCYDEPACQPYAEFVTETESVFSIGLLFGRAGQGTPLHLQRDAGITTPAETEPEAISFWRFWLQNNAVLTHGRHRWERV